MKQFVLMFTLFVLFFCSTSVIARHDLADKLESEGEIKTLEEILNIANKEHKGRILEAELETRQGQYVYQIDLIDNDGVIWELEYNASSGRLITKQRD